MNLTQQEISLEYTTDKNMLIEAQESCRVPVPVNRCPLEKMPQEEPLSETGKNNLCDFFTFSSNFHYISV